MTDTHLVTIICLIAGGLCFGLYAIEAMMALFAPPNASVAGALKETQDKARALLAQGATTGVDDITKLLDALSKATDSLAKAGPALTSLVGAILFLAIAALSSGALRGSPPAERPAAHESANSLEPTP